RPNPVANELDIDTILLRISEKNRAKTALPVHRRVVPFGASMTISTAVGPVRPSDEAAAKRGERRALGVACGAHMLHDGYTDLVWVALPIWQAEFGLNFAMVGLLRTIDWPPLSGPGGMLV